MDKDLEILKALDEKAGLAPGKLDSRDRLNWSGIVGTLWWLRSDVVTQSVRCQVVVTCSGTNGHIE